MDKKFTPKYLPLFERDVAEATDYIKNVLQNPEAAARLIDEIEKAINQRLFNPTAFGKYVSVKDRKQPYYTIKAGNYLIFYVVIGDIMEMRRFIYSKRDLPNLV